MVQTTEVPFWSWRELVSGKTRVLTHRIAYLIDENGPILGIFWPLPLPIKPLRGDEGEGLSVKQWLKIAWLPPSTPCVCILRRDGSYWLITNFTIVPIQVSNGPWWSGFGSLELGSLKMEWTDHLGTISNAKKWRWWSGLCPGWRYVL